jgi:hypothetical protein
MKTYKQFVEQTNIIANELKPGDAIEDINPDCKHYKSKGVVTKVKKIKDKTGTVGNKICYKCTNDGDAWTKGQSLDKTEIQLKKK